jgi:hypothetical protein
MGVNELNQGLNQLTESEKIGAYIEGCIKYVPLKNQKKRGAGLKPAPRWNKLKLTNYEE